MKSGDLTRIRGQNGPDDDYLAPKRQEEDADTMERQTLLLQIILLKSYELKRMTLYFLC